MKKYFLLFCLLISFPLSLHAQGDWVDSFLKGMEIARQREQMEMERRRLKMEEQLNQQRLELMRQQAEIAREQQDRERNNYYEKVYMEGYQKGVSDVQADFKKNEMKIQLMLLDQFGDAIFKETSIENLLYLKKTVNENKEQHPAMSIFRVYNVLIDDRLRELQPVPETKTDQSKKNRIQQRK